MRFDRDCLSTDQILSVGDASDFLKQPSPVIRLIGQCMTSAFGDGHSSLPASAVTSAAAIVPFATAQCNGRPRSRTSPSRCPMMRQTMAEACDQSPSDGSRGHAIVASESPEVGTVRKTGKSKWASRRAVPTSAAISSEGLSDDFALCVGRRGFYELGHCVVLRGCGGIYLSLIAHSGGMLPHVSYRRGCAQGNSPTSPDRAPPVENGHFSARLH